MKATLIGRGTWGKKLVPYIEKRFDLVSVQGKGYEIPANIDAVFIATPPETHYDIAKECLLNKKHVFCEKPLTMRYGDGIKLSYLARKLNKVLYTDYLETTAPSRIKMVELAPNIGLIHKIYAVTLQHGKFADHSVAWQLASHQLSMLSLFCDLSKINFSIEKNNGTGEKIFDYCIISGKNFEIDQKIFLTASRKKFEREKKFMIAGDRGTVTYDKYRGSTITYFDKRISKYDYFRYDEDNNIEYSIDRFIDCIENGAESNIEMSLTITKILEKLHESC